MGLDIRLPIGAMFTLFGLLLTVFGVVGDKSTYQRSLGININFTWGLALLVFGLVMLALGKRGMTIAEPVHTIPEGQRMMTELKQRDSEVEH